MCRGRVRPQPPMVWATMDDEGDASPTISTGQPTVLLSSSRYGHLPSLWEAKASGFQVRGTAQVRRVTRPTERQPMQGNEATPAGSINMECRQHPLKQPGLKSSENECGRGGMAKCDLQKPEGAQSVSAGFPKVTATMLPVSQPISRTKDRHATRRIGFARHGSTSAPKFPKDA